MFRRKTTITRPDRDLLMRATHSSVNLLRWGFFVDELSRELKCARVIDPARVPDDAVTMHSTVRIRDSKRGAAEVYTLVYPDEADPRSGKLSVLTTVGTALLGRRSGDLVRVATPDGVRSIRVEAILFQPEAAARVTRTRASLRRARRSELLIVWTLSALVVLTMLPAVLAVAAACGAVTLWRRDDQLRPMLIRCAAGVRSALQLAQRAIRILLAAGQAAFQPRARLLADSRPIHCDRRAAPRILGEVKKIDHEVPGPVRQHWRRGRGHSGSAARTSAQTLPARVSAVRSTAAPRANRSNGCGSRQQTAAS
jgi:regulator of nucleoside diphosphate kinase